jgi:hypothetical protein
VGQRPSWRLRAIAAELGLPETNYTEEGFDATVLEEKPVELLKVVESKTFKVEFSKQSRTIEVTGEQTAYLALIGDQDTVIMRQWIVRGLQIEVIEWVC